MSSAPTVASWPRRIGALLVDWFVALLTVSLLTGTPIYGAPQNPWYPLLAFFVEVSLTVGLLGFSIGKRIFGVVVIGPDGAPIGLWRGVVRTALVCVVVPALLVNGDRRGLQDVAARSAITLRRPATA